MLMVVQLTKQVHVPPAYYNAGLTKYIKTLLKNQVEGSLIQNVGIVIAVVGEPDVTTGVILPELDRLDSPSRVGGSASFKATYDALVFVPFTNEVVDVIVTSVNDSGVFGQAGPLKVFIEQSNLRGYDLDTTATRWVSKESDNRKIESGDICRCRIKGINMKAKEQEFFAICSIDTDVLGPTEVEDSFEF